MAPESSLDDRGRVTILPEYRKRLGKRFVQVLMPDGLHLVPLSGDLAFHGPSMSIEEQQNVAEEEALKRFERSRPTAVKPVAKRRRKPAHRGH